MVKLALVGFGRVGRWVAWDLAERGRRIEARYGVRLVLESVITSRGALHRADGLPMDLFRSERLRDHWVPLEEFGWPVDRSRAGLEGVLGSGAQVLIEATPTDLESGQPGLDHALAALGRGIHVVFLNKGPLVVAWRRLREVAGGSGARIKAAGATAAALPAMDLGDWCLAGARIELIEGILNGTTNFILTRMEEGMDRAAALAEAQRRGIAEANPRLDLEGWDTAAKLLILANLLMEAELELQEVPVEGIQTLTAEEVRAARTRGEVVKLLGRAVRRDSRVEAAVRPVVLPVDHPLAGVRETTKAVRLVSDLMGELTVIGGASSPAAAAAAAVKDVINLAREGAVGA